MSEQRVPNSARIAEFWLTIKTLLAGKVDQSTLEDYPTVTAVSTAIATALVGYATTEGIKATLSNYPTIQDVSDTINASLVNYSTTSNVQTLIAKALEEYLTAAEVNAKILEAIRSITTFKKEVVDSLPEVGEDNTIYLIPNPDSEEGNSKLEYLWIDGAYELIGSTSVDLSGYWSKEELGIMTAEELQEIIDG